jgi:hypothetical protein
VQFKLDDASNNVGVVCSIGDALANFDLTNRLIQIKIQDVLPCFDDGGLGANIELDLAAPFISNFSRGRSQKRLVLKNSRDLTKRTREVAKSKSRTKLIENLNESVEEFFSGIKFAIQKDGRIGMERPAGGGGNNDIIRIIRNETDLCDLLGMGDGRGGGGSDDDGDIFLD